MVIGIPLGIMFTGALIVQCIVYFRAMRPRDTQRMWFIIYTFLVLDLLHTCLLWGTAWECFITWHGSRPDAIPTALSLSVLVTGISTFIAHSVYSWKIFRFSKHNYWLTGPIIFLATLRLLASAASTSEMLVLKSFEEFRSKIGWVFGVGLALSSVVDVLIAGVMMLTLKQSRQQSLSLDGVIDSLIIYTFESGSVTAITTIVAMITWFSMNNLIFLALHFVIAKLYANCAVAMLNYRQFLSQSTGNAMDLDVIRLGEDPSSHRQGRRLIFLSSARSQLQSAHNIAPMEVNVTKTMQMHTDSSLMDEPKLSHEDNSPKQRV